MSLKGSNNHKMKVIPNLTKRMAQKQATMQVLAKLAGVSVTTIDLARKGRPVHEGLADSITEALENNKFSYTTVGRKGKGMKTLPQSANADSIKVKPTYLTNFCYGDDPDLIHSVRTSKPNVLFLPIHKTEEEIDRMWEYNRMMGRC